MKFSESWLKSWVNPALSTEQLTYLLTMAGLEVEGTTPAAPAFSGVVVAEVKTLRPHENADRLRVTEVDVGTGTLVQIVCGAPNVAVGMKVPCAMIGARLPPAADGDDGFGAFEFHRREETGEAFEGAERFVGFGGLDAHTRDEEAGAGEGDVGE